MKVPGVGLTPVAGSTDKAVRTRQEPTELRRAASLAKSSTASLGKFQPDLSSSLEKQAKKNPAGTGKKRKFDPLVSAGEKEKNLKILDQVRGGNCMRLLFHYYPLAIQVQSKKPKLDVGKAIGAALHVEETERSAQKKKLEAKKGKKGGGGRGGKHKKGKKMGGGGGGTKRRGAAGKKPKKGGGGKKR